VEDNGDFTDETLFNLWETLEHKNNKLTALK